MGLRDSRPCVPSALYISPPRGPPTSRSSFGRRFDGESFWPPPRPRHRLTVVSSKSTNLPADHRRPADDRVRVRFAVACQCRWCASVFGRSRRRRVRERRKNKKISSVRSAVRATLKHNNIIVRVTS